MKKIALLTLLVLIIIGCSSSHIKYVEYREIKSYDNYNTPPKKVISKTYNVEYIDGVIHEEKTFDFIIHFDPKGNKTESISIRLDGKRNIYRNQYDKYGNQILYESIYNDSVVDFFIKYHYNKYNQIIKKEWIGKKDTTVTNYSYNKRQRTVEIIKKDKQGEIVEITKETYDKKLRRIKKEAFNPKNELTILIEYRFDENDNVNYKNTFSVKRKSRTISERIYNKQKDLIMTRKTTIKDQDTIVEKVQGKRAYKYDKNNNRIEEKGIYKDKITYIVRNQYTYY